MATLRGETVDRPAVCFYEINGFLQDGSDPDPFNVYNDPSWRPLLELARKHSDCVTLSSVPFLNEPDDPQDELRTEKTWEENGSIFVRTALRTDAGDLTALTRRDKDIDTIWMLEHPLKTADDLRAWVDLPYREAGGEPDVKHIHVVEEQIGDAGIVCIDTSDPLCNIAYSFGMSDLLLVALMENDLMHRALEKIASTLLPRVEAIAKALPGRLWRIYGPEYAAPPFMPPYLFEEYVTRYVTPMVEAIQKHGGFARVHSHGKLRDILDHIAATGCSALDPIEPPPQGDVELSYVREKYGKQMVLFGNLELSDIVNMPTEEFREKIKQALDEGTSGEGRGFVLMPSAAPSGRKLTAQTVNNFEEMLRQAGAL